MPSEHVRNLIIYHYQFLHRIIWSNLPPPHPTKSTQTSVPAPSLPPESWFPGECTRVIPGMRAGSDWGKPIILWVSAHQLGGGRGCAAIYVITWWLCGGGRGAEGHHALSIHRQRAYSATRQISTLLEKGEGGRGVVPSRPLPNT